VSGQVRELLADFNNEVRAGQVIARIDPETFEHRVRQAQADVEAARANVLTAQANQLAVQAALSRAQVDAEEARRDLERKRDLVARNFLAQIESDRAEALVRTTAESVKSAQAQVRVVQAQIGSAQAVVRQREAALAQAQVDLGRTRITSPVDGIVIKRSVELGQTVAASLQTPELFVIARNLRDMQVEASIDESDVGRVRTGLQASFTVDAFPGRNFEGTVTQVRKAAQTVANVVTYVAVIGFANADGRLLPGMTANVRIVTDRREAVLKVPNAALRVRMPGVEPVAMGGAGPGSAPGGVSGTAPGSTPGGAPGGAPGSGAAAALRGRLISELKLDATQTARLDAIFEASRPRLMALRDVPAEQRAKARERVSADIRAAITDILNPEQRQRYEAMNAAQASGQAQRGRIHVVGDDGQPKAYDVRLGITDGTATEILVPQAAPLAAVLKEGAVVVTGLSGGTAAPAARPSSGPRLPF
jgi:HlyD family secretion protein